MKPLCITILLVLLAVGSQAKRKRKFEGDFEFAEEDESKSYSKTNGAAKVGEKKRWIQDPNSDLCHPLNCKKKELCLLEDAFTAVCVSKKELHKNGDIILPRSKLEDSDDIFYDTEDDDSEDDQQEDVITQQCNPCPVIKPTFLCGIDNRTYSSLCRLDYHNCIHRTNIKVLCKGFCPCKDGDIHLRKKQKQAERMNNLMNKYKATVHGGVKASQVLADKYTFTPQDFKYENKHYKYIKYTKHDNKISKDILTVTNPPYYEDKERLRGDNEVFDSKPTSGNLVGSSWNKDCSPVALQAMGDRLLDWFSVIMTDAKRRRTHNKGKGARFPYTCKGEVRWMFQHLDIDSDGQLSLQELYDLEHDENEHCIKPFLDACDSDRDIFVNPHEWCKCFDKTDRPCAAIKRRITSNLGTYVPECDAEGYYHPTQCHSAVGMCWCVDKHGVEVPNSRTRGKPNCDVILGGKSKPTKLSPEEDDNDDEDEDDSDQELEGSADQPLDF
uniref:Thyroglobulin type-1 domain-containing protein n=1 Tax=Clastoptera arizonana TaxID=38151 RepID=A0A1B6C9E9_9HEMI